MSTPKPAAPSSRLRCTPEGLFYMVPLPPAGGVQKTEDGTFFMTATAASPRPTDPFRNSAAPLLNQSGLQLIGWNRTGMLAIPYVIIRGDSNSQIEDIATLCTPTQRQRNGDLHLFSRDAQTLLSSTYNERWKPGTKGFLESCLRGLGALSVGKPLTLAALQAK